MKRTGVTTQYWLATLALASLLSAAPAGAQSQGTLPQDRDSDMTWRQTSGLDQFLDNHPDVSDQLRKDPSLVNNQEFVEDHPALKQYLQDHPEVREQLNQNPNAVMRQEQRFDRNEDRDRDQNRDRDQDRDMTRSELSKMDRFMDSHPEIAEQVQKNPSLLDDRRFVQSHPALQQFLAEHPGVREQLRENPNVFMSAEGRFDQRQDARLASITDQFLDNHPEIAEQLRRNPALVNNRDFVQRHPELQQFLAKHPELQQEFQSNPNAFMQREQRFDQREDMRGDRDATRGELANMDRFMDSHPEIAEQLHRNPALVNNKEFVQNHPELQQFLASHPGVREEYRENPSAFMNQEQRFDQRQDAGFHHDGDMSRGQVSSFHEFLEGHSNISAELSKNPALATNQEYLENHPALQTYLKTNPQVKEELSENPQSFVKSAQSFESTPGTMPKTTTPSKGTAKPAPPQK